MLHIIRLLPVLVAIASSSLPVYNSFNLYTADCRYVNSNSFNLNIVVDCRYVNSNSFNLNIVVDCGYVNSNSFNLNIVVDCHHL